MCDDVVFHSSMFKPAAFLSKLTSVKMCKHLRGVNTFVFFLMCSLKANPSSVPLGKQLVNEAVDTAELRLRETENRDVDLVSRSHEADDVWVRHNEVQDEQCLLWAKILLGISRQSTERTSWISRKELVMPGPVSKVAETGTRIQTVTMWSMRCFFRKSMCQLFLC